MSAGAPKVSIIVPVYNRTSELERALASIVGQTHADWECIVVDDASTVAIAPVVEAFHDPRLRVLRRDENGGPNGARRVGLEAARGTYVTFLDSDWTFYPWAVERAVGHLDRHPEVVAAIGLVVVDSCLRVRVRNTARIVTPDEFRMEHPLPDRASMVRRIVVDQWLAIRQLFTSEILLWAHTSLTHSTFVVDEPWAISYVDGADRLGRTHRTKRFRTQTLNDRLALLDSTELLISHPCVTIDLLLEDALYQLLLLRHPAALTAARALRARGISPAAALRNQVMIRVRRRIPFRGTPQSRTVWA